MKRGLFITLEGGEGVGKSSNLAFVKQLLEGHQVDVLVTREPGGTPMAEEIRDILLQKRSEKVSSKTELLLMFAARAQHLAEKIHPALAQGTWVLSDRFTDATYAYQSGGRGVPESHVALLETFVQESLRPDLTILLDAPVEVGMARARNRGALDRFETERLAFFEGVRSNYLRRAREQAERFLLVDATQALEQVQQEIKHALLTKLAQ